MIQAGTGGRRVAARAALANAAVAFAVAIVAAHGCASSVGDRLMSERSFKAAEAAYDAEVSARPGDRQVVDKRRAARVAAVREKLELARTLREAGRHEAALATLDQALRLEARWIFDVSSDVTAARDLEVAAAGAELAAVTRRALEARRPMTAARIIDKLLPMPAHPRLAPARRQARADIDRTGQAVCADLSARHTGEVYLGRLLASYCALFGVTLTPAVPVEQRRGLRVSGRLENTTDAQHRALEVGMAAAFRETPWYAADASALAAMDLTGSYDVQLEQRQVVLSAPYRTVDRSTLRRSGLYPPIRVETESEQVFQYTADEYRAHYEIDATIRLELGGSGPPFVLMVKRAEDKRAHQHDTSFPRAGVQPQRADLPTATAWLERYLQRKQGALVAKLRARWTKAYCAGPTFTPEEAARCAYGRQGPPAIAASLATLLGDDARLLLDQLDGPHPADDKAAPDKKKDDLPEIEDTAVEAPAGVEAI